MTQGPFLRKMILFAVPLAISSVLQLLFNAADVVVMGRFAGSQALAAVSLTGSLIGLITNLFIGFSVGTNVLAARQLGAKEDAAVSQTASTSIVLSILFGGCLAGLGQLAAKPMLQAMAAPPDIIGLSTLYLRIYFLGTPASMLYNFSSALLRAAGDTKRPLYCLTISGALNVALNLLFVICFQMSVAGVALATVISQFVACILSLTLLYKEKGPLHLSLRRLKFYKEQFVLILRIGLPAGIQSTILGFSNVVIQTALNGFGSIIVAGNGAAGNIEGFIYVAMNAFCQACVTFTSHNYGARNYRNIARLVWIGIGGVCATGILLSTLVWSFSGPLLGIYSPDPAVVAAGQQRMVIICHTYFLCGIMDVLVGALRGIGYSFAPMLICLTGSCAIRLLWIFTIFKWYPRIEVLYLCYPVGWLVTILALGAFFQFAYRHIQAAPPRTASPHP